MIHGLSDSTGGTGGEFLRSGVYRGHGLDLRHNVDGGIRLLDLSLATVFPRWPYVLHDSLTNLGVELQAEWVQVNLELFVDRDAADRCKYNPR